MDNVCSCKCDNGKGGFDVESLQEVALKNEEYKVFYQPIFNHSTGTLVGAEALIRWIHPEFGVLSPAVFIPTFECNGFITKLDLYVCEKVCAFIRESIDKNYTLVPISINMSRKDLEYKPFIDELDAIRVKYNVPVKYLRLELTESAVIGSNDEVIAFIDRLHKLGYKIEMDDFGSGASSLNVLKDVDFDILKLDLKFLSGDLTDGRGGTIVSSIIRMAKWLNLPVIAEGVETIPQADFMRSIGCDYIQGYLYSKPIPKADYVALITGKSVGAIVPQMSIIDTLDAGKFWSPESQETLIFSNYVGGACIFEYNNGVAETLRVNEKYLKELGMNLTEKDIISTNPREFFDDNNWAIFEDMVQKAIASGDEQECETWLTIKSKCCGDEKMCIRFTIRLIGRSDAGCLFYSMIRNITAEKNRYDALIVNEKKFKMASEQVNIYFWEYTVATKEMRPCFRCMRDLGLPALVTNYPEPAIEMGIFPPDYADMYRDWHRQIAEGVKSLEAVIPLTVGRVPFLVRYTTEFDENGKAVKAYGSAALVVDTTNQNGK